MGTEWTSMTLGKAFFEQVVRPAMARVCPRVLEAAAVGRFGWGSECFGMEDALSRDHHWGPRVDLLLPASVFAQVDESVWREVSTGFPDSFEGFALEPGHVGGAGLAPEDLDGYLMRMIGRTTPPVSDAEWLAIPEEDILHVINGEVWHDGAGAFTAMREALGAYYPDVVWRRRVAHWCRYASGMGLYALYRAVLRENWVNAHTTLARSMKFTIELAFLLNKTYFPYDKWLYPKFRELPELAPAMTPLIDELAGDKTPWDRRIQLLEQCHDLLDERMVAIGLVRPHERFKRSESSGYRLLEWCYYDVLRGLSEESRALVPETEQRYMEAWVVEYVAGLDDATWQHLLCLEPAE